MGVSKTYHLIIFVEYELSLKKISPTDIAYNCRFCFCVNLRYLREKLNDGKN